MKSKILPLTATCLAILAATSIRAAEPESLSMEVEIDKTDAYVLETVTPHYPLEMLERGVQGRTLLKLRVDVQGEVSGVSVVSSTNKAFSSEAIKSVSKWYFQPGTVNGEAVPQTVLVPVNFLIEDLQSPSLASL